jgi:hypothetical protein
MPVVSTITPQQADFLTALKSFLVDVTALPAAQVIAGLGNRVPEPATPTFVVMTPLLFERQGKALDTTLDVKFTGSISGTVLTVSAITHGTILVNAILFGVNVLVGTQITAQLTGPAGGVGTYSVNLSQSLASQILASGTVSVLRVYALAIQLDFHSADFSSCSLAQTVATLFKDDYAVTFFSALPAPQNIVLPLWCEDAKMVPFVNAEQQWEWRWVLDVNLEARNVVTVPQQYADAVKVARIAADEFFPP